MWLLPDYNFQMESSDFIISNNPWQYFLRDRLTFFFSKKMSAERVSLNNYHLPASHYFKQIVFREKLLLVWKFNLVSSFSFEDSCSSPVHSIFHCECAFEGQYLMNLYEFYCLLQNECVNVNPWLWRSSVKARDTLALWKCGCPWQVTKLALETPLWDSLLPCELFFFPPLTFVRLHILSRFRAVVSAWISLSFYGFEVPSAFSGFFSALLLLVHYIFPYRLSTSHLLERIKFPSTCTFPSCFLASWAPLWSGSFL